MTVALVVIGLLALAVFSPGFRKSALVLIAICFVAGASLVLWGWYESQARARAEEQERRIARTYLSQEDIELVDLTLSSSHLEGRLRNKSSLYGVNKVGLKITLQDCVPPSDSIAPLRRCEIVGEHNVTVSAAVPSGQARDFSEYISWWNEVRPRGEFKWEYGIEYIEASKPTREEAVVIKKQLDDQVSLRRRALELLPQLRSLESVDDGEFAALGRRPADTLRNPGFKGTFNAALTDLPLMGSEADSWISRLELVSSGNEIVSVPRLGNILLVSGCKPHFCGDQNVYIVYRPTNHVLFGVARLEDSRWHVFGNVDPDAQAVAVVAYARDKARGQLPPVRLGFPLSDSARQTVAGVLSTVALDGMSPGS